MANNQQLLLGEGAGSAPAVFVEDVFSTYLYTGTGSTQTITNNIDLSTKGGLVWVKARSTGGSHILRDSARGPTNALITNETYAQGSGYVTTFTSTGYTDGTVITNGATFASWTFREQPKFFDIVTYTGDGASSQTINHNLGASPGCIITKRTDDSGNWTTWHRSFADTKTYIYLNTTAASVNVPSADAMTVSSTSFTVGTNQVFGNGSGFVYVAYLFAHDAGGFGLAGTDNVISCGSVTADGSGNLSVNLGYEPQWLMIKASSSTSNWWMRDIMRGMTVSEGGTNYGQALYANLSDAESNTSYYINPNATGFTGTGWVSGVTYIYIAIRRGPMKVPTVGTSVFSPVTYSADGTYDRIINTTITPDMIIDSVRNTAGPDHQLFDRLRGWPFNSLWTNSTSAENVAGVPILATPNQMGSIQIAASGTNYLNFGSYTYIVHAFRRAPSFFDEVCWTGTNADQTLTHNLTVVPELIIYKVRGTGGYNWEVSSNFAASNYVKTILNLTNASSTLTYVGGGSISAQPTATQFSVGQYYNPASTMVAYLFATCAGVSKVGSYTGNGSSQTIACGFAAGSRFVMIKRTDSTGDWYVWDSARGIVAGNDPHLSLNDSAAEVTTDDSVDTDNSGFIVNQDAATNVNVTSATYIFLAIA